MIAKVIHLQTKIVTKIGVEVECWTVNSVNFCNLASEGPDIIMHQ